MIKCISFDLQGTITDSSFCDCFWIDILPEIYAIRNNISKVEAIKEIKREYGNNPTYSFKYYDNKYWSDLLEFDVIEELKKRNVKPKVNMK